ncbi:MAG TPA: hypothetical protein ENN41_08300 [Sediminispirochaeta sp.]|nr:hypothetical protein [Sediminispirochaeta sp.]
MKNKLTFISIVLFVSLGLASGFAGGAQEAQGDFLSRLDTALENSGFSEKEVQQIIDAAGTRDWEGAEEADAELVAEALQLAKAERTELNAEQNAELALELALNATELRKENYDQSVVAQTIMNTVRNMIRQINEWKSGEGEENLGRMIRNTVRTEARKAAQSQEQKKGETARESAPEADKGSSSGSSARRADTPSTPGQ